MNKKGKFGKSLFGFKRADVIDYIEQANTDSITAIKDKDDTINSLKEQLAAKTTELEAANAQNTELNEQIKAVEIEFAQMKQLAVELKNELNVFEEKSKQIGEVYVEAKVSADRIIRDANENADNIVNTANFCAAKTLSDITDAQKDIVTAKRSFYDMMGEFEKRLETISQSINTAKSKISPTTGFSVNTNITEDDLFNSSVLPDHK